MSLLDVTHFATLFRPMEKGHIWIYNRINIVEIHNHEMSVCLLQSVNMSSVLKYSFLAHESLLSSSSLHFHLHIHIHLSLNRQGRRGTPDDFTTSFLHFFLFSPLPCETWRTPGLSSPWCCLPIVLCPFTVPFKMVWPDLMNGRHNHTTVVCVSLQCSEVFVWSDCLLDLGMDFLVGNMVFVWDV